MTSHPRFTVLSVSEMYAADRIAIASGVSGFTLMTNAGTALADYLLPSLKTSDRVLIACGKGNNGGDGFIAAEVLRAHSIQVDVLLIDQGPVRKGDARLAFEQLSTSPFHYPALAPCDYTVVIDALLGAGLDRDLDGKLEKLVNDINLAAAHSSTRVISVDVPTGVNGDTGQVCGTAIRAHETITFFRKKPAHLLLPGRELCGTVSVAQIGIQDNVLGTIKPSLMQNDPLNWQDHCPRTSISDHKYTRGHAAVLSGGATSTGAARLAADAALRTGAGLVTVCCKQESIAINAAHLTAIMLRHTETAEQLHQFLEDSRITSIVLGPGLGVGEQTRQLVETTLRSSQSVVLDADAMTSFENQPDVLFDMIKLAKGTVVLTPHTGEFNRLFNGGLRTSSSPTSASKITQARNAAKTSGSIIVFKGPDTVIASPAGTTAINTNAPPWLATAGSGDVLAGTIGGWLAQGMDPFKAACAACWMHGESANRFGPGLIATDITLQYPLLLRDLV